MNLLFISCVSIACVITLVASAVAVVAARRLSSSVRKISSHALRIESLEATCTEMHSLLAALETRDRMRKVRARSTSSDGLADSNSPKPGDPNWKAFMRQQMASGQLRTTNVPPKGNTN
jgi:hypothetical protein